MAAEELEAAEFDWRSSLKDVTFRRRKFM